MPSIPSSPIPAPAPATPCKGARCLSLADPRVLLIFAILIGYVLWPVLQVLGESVWTRGEGATLEPWRQFVEAGHWRYAMRSVWISLATVALSGTLGTAMAFFYFRLDFPGRSLLTGLALFPISLPPLVGVFAIWTLMGEGGAFHELTRLVFKEGFWIEKGITGVLLVHVYSMYVYYFVLIGGALAGFDETQVEASRDLGATRFQTLTRIVLPQLLPAFAGASLLTFMTSMASYTAPLFYMAGRPVLTLGIQQALEDSHFGLASADCVVLTLCAGLFLYLSLRFEHAFQGGTRGAARRSARFPRSPLARAALTGVASLVTLLLLAPHLALLRESLVRPGTGFVGVPAEYTFSNYSRLGGEEAWRPIANSLQSSGLATSAVLFFTILTAWLIARRDFRGRLLARGLVMLPWALPGTVIAIGLLWITREPGLLTFGAPLRGTIAILALAYFIRMVPLSHRTLAAGLAQVSEELEKAARDLGASPWVAFVRVTLPLLLPAVLAAATLTFVTCMGEFTSSVLLQSAGSEPISVQIDNLRRGPGGVHIASAYSMLLMAMIALTFTLFGRHTRRAY